MRVEYSREQYEAITCDAKESSSRSQQMLKALRELLGSLGTIHSLHSVEAFEEDIRNWIN